MAKKRGANSTAIPMVGTKVGKKVKQPIATPAGFRGRKAGSPKASKGGGTKLKIGGNTSNVTNPPRGGSY